MNNVVVENEEGKNRLRSTMEGGNTFWVLFSNMLIVLFTAGIGFPWAIIRQYRLYIESVNIPEEVNLDALTQDADNYKDATGDDLADILDVDFDF